MPAGHVNASPATIAGKAMTAAGPGAKPGSKASLSAARTTIPIGSHDESSSVRRILGFSLPRGFSDDGTLARWHSITT